MTIWASLYQIHQRSHCTTTNVALATLHLSVVWTVASSEFNYSLLKYLLSYYVQFMASDKIEIKQQNIPHLCTILCYLILIFSLAIYCM